MNRRFFCSLMLGGLANLCLLGCSRELVKIRYREDLLPPEAVSLEHPHAIVVYDSWTGNTRTIAEALADEMACEAVKVDDAGNYDMSAYDLVVAGSPVHGGAPTDAMADFLSGLTPPQASAVFVTFGAPSFGPMTADKCLDSMAEKLNTTCIGRFRCHGFHHIFRTYPDHPDAADKADAARFAAGIMERWRWRMPLPGTKQAAGLI